MYVHFFAQRKNNLKNLVRVYKCHQYFYLKYCHIGECPQELPWSL